MELLTENQNVALQRAREGHNLLILGQSGTGKSVITQRIAHELNLMGKCVGLTATTGIAALNIKGKTIHSWSGIGDGRESGDKLLEKIKSQREYGKQLQNILTTDCLIIDEISMLSQKLFENIEEICRRLRESDMYFGGMQVVAVGDFLQLPPVPDHLKLDPGHFCFQSPHFQNIFKHIICLREVMRQQEGDFIKCINDVSRGDLPEDTRNLLHRMQRQLPPGPDPIHLCAKKFDCDVVNASKLIDMKGEAQTYVSIDSGEKKYLQNLSVPENLHLKLKSPVMLLKNLSETLVNGLRGEVTKLDKDYVSVYFDQINSEVELRPEMFFVYSSIREKIIASRTQIPICLAFSITIHKAQGLTLGRIEVDASNIFSAGQLGVAIGRTTAKKHLRVINFHPSSVINQPDSILDFYMSP